MPNSDTGSTLTPRERECLLRLAHGERVSTIGYSLGIAKVTVELHVKNARKKLGAGTTTEAVAKAIVYRIIMPEFGEMR